MSEVSLGGPTTDLIAQLLGEDLGATLDQRTGRGVAVTSTGPGDGVQGASARSTPDEEHNLWDSLKALRALYASLPTLECKGLCVESCQTKIGMSMAERARIERYLGRELPAMMWETVGVPCPLLTYDGKCTVYRIRPMICRMWGMTQTPTFRCSHGCVPDRWLSDIDVMRRLIDSFETGSPPAESAFLPEIREMLDMPEIAPLVSRWVAGRTEEPHDAEEIYAAIERLRERRDQATSP